MFATDVGGQLTTRDTQTSIKTIYKRNANLKNLIKRSKETVKLVHIKWKQKQNKWL